MKEKTLSWYVIESRKVATLISKHRDKYTCLKCGRKAEHGWKMDGSHIKPKGTYKSMSADVDNIKTLCFMCHKWWHSSPTDSSQWFRKTYPKWIKELDRRAKLTIKMGKFEWKKKLEELREEYNKLIN